MRRALLVGLCLGLSACARTHISPVKPTRAVDNTYVPEGGCNVRDFDAATDVPQGATNLGWVSVPFDESDEATFLKLRQKICEAGGDALSQPAWVRDTNDQTPLLKANAWVLP